MQQKIRRNALCPCGSAVKYKKCCLNKLSIVSESEEDQREQLRTQFRQKIEMDRATEVVFLEPNSLSLKMSEIIIELAEELLEDSDTIAEQKSAIQFACTAWNFAILKERSELLYQNEFHFLFKHMKIRNQKEKNNIRLLIEMLVDKKMEYYLDINRWIVDYQIDFVGDELTINIASVISSEETDNPRMLDFIPET